MRVAAGADVVQKDALQGPSTQASKEPGDGPGHLIPVTWGGQGRDAEGAVHGLGGCVHKE